MKKTENLNHFDSLGNVYLTILEDAQAAHRTARAKHLQLTELLKDKGVKFGDIRNFLYNEAKRAHLYKKNYWSDKEGKFTFPPKKAVAHLSWANAIVRYANWLGENFTDYGVTNVKKPTSKKKAKVVTRKDKDGNVTQSTVTDHEGVAKTKTIDAIVEELSPAQVQSIIENNWELLARFCKEKGASEEFNLLADKLGLEEYQV